MDQLYSKRIFDTIQAELENHILGNAPLLGRLIMAFFARGHVLIEGPPGTAKTLTTKLLARVLAKSFHRIQFTSDMLPSDILGAHIYSPSRQNFDFIKGPIFSDFILADEINRTPPRTQSALLEAMEEKQVTMEGTLYPLDPDFFVIATQNPQDYEGTFPLPEVQIDRFLLKLVVAHASSKTEVQLLHKIIDGSLPPDIDKIPVIDFDRKKIDKEIQDVLVDDSIIRYISDILHHTRTYSMLPGGSSIRGGIALVRCARIQALMAGRLYVIPDDIKSLAVDALRHRIKLSPEAQISQISEESIIKEILQKLPFPE